MKRDENVQSPKGAPPQNPKRSNTSYCTPLGVTQKKISHKKWQAQIGLCEVEKLNIYQGLPYARATH